MNKVLESFPTSSSREKILLAAFLEMHQHGYQGMRIDAILKATGLAKGAIYHHFPNKKSLAYAVLDEILLEHNNQYFANILQQYEDPIEANCTVLTYFSENVTDDELALGCPLNNLAQEMSGLDEGFKQRLNQCYESWLTMVHQSFERGQEKGYVKAEVNTQQTALFIICSHQGIVGAAKCMQSKEILQQQTQVLCDFIQSLRPIHS